MLDLNKNHFKCTTVNAKQYLWTKEVFDALKNNKDTGIAKVKFFLPYSSWNWYISEIEHITDDDIILSGLTCGTFKEYGSISLKELHSIPVKFYLGVERDILFSETPLKDCD